MILEDYYMTCRELISYLEAYGPNTEISVAIHETNTSQFVDSTSCIIFSECEEGPMIHVDVEAEKFRSHLI